MKITIAPDSFISKLPPECRPKGWMSAEQAQEKYTAGEEKKLQKLVANFLSLHGIYFEQDRMDKRTSGKKGRPDFRVCYKGRFVAIECKTHAGRLSREQVNEMLRIHKSGGYAFVVTCREDFKAWFLSIDEDIKRLDG